MMSLWDISLFSSTWSGRRYVPILQNIEMQNIYLGNVITERYASFKIQIKSPSYYNMEQSFEGNLLSPTPRQYRLRLFNLQTI
jgi:hypothetical protein